MRNGNYTSEMSSSMVFLQEHKGCGNLERFTRWLEANRALPHSERWSETYDFIDTYFPEVKYTNIVTGLVYLFED